MPASTSNTTSMSTMLLVGSIAVAMIGVILLIKVCLFIRSTEETKGKITGFETIPGRTSVTLPWYEFKDRDGKIHKARSSSTSAWDNFVEGSEVTVRYNPHDPESAKLAGFSHLFLFPVAIMVVGGIGVMGSILISMLERFRPH